jgi:anti-sigma B factor antagonist
LLRRAEIFEAETICIDDAVIVRISGELEVTTVPQLRDCLERVALTGPARFVIDLSELDFCDSAGLALFVEWQRRAREANYDFVLRSPGRHIRSLLELTLLTDLLEDD